MYELPQNAELAPLIRATVEAITFTENTIQFVFSGNASITLESGYELSSPAKPSSIERASVPVVESRLMMLLGDSVKDLQRERGLLKVLFTSGHVLGLDATSPRYESLRIQIGQREIVV